MKGNKMPNLNESGIILFYEPQPSRLVWSNGENDQAVIPNDLLPENLRNGSTMLDAIMCVRYLVQRIRTLESENTELRQYLKDYCIEIEEDILTEEIINSIPEDWAEASMKNNIRNGGGRNYL